MKRPDNDKNKASKSFGRILREIIDQARVVCFPGSDPARDTGRPVANIAADRPLIDVDALISDDRGNLPDDARRRRSGDALGDVRVDADQAAAGEIDERIGLSRAPQPQRRPAGMAIAMPSLS